MIESMVLANKAWYYSYVMHKAAAYLWDCLQADVIDDNS